MIAPTQKHVDRNIVVFPAFQRIKCFSSSMDFITVG
jgi:hypothetical protein